MNGVMKVAVALVGLLLLVAVVTTGSLPFVSSSKLGAINAAEAAEKKKADAGAAAAVAPPPKNAAPSHLYGTKSGPMPLDDDGAFLGATKAAPMPRRKLPDGGWKIGWGEEPVAPPPQQAPSPVQQAQ